MEQLPVPSHLEGILIIDKKKSNEYKLVASLNCCNQDYFKIQTSRNDFVCIIKAICPKCNQEFIIFDNRLHGWDGYVCHLFRDKQEAEFKKENCKKCKNEEYIIKIKIESQGEQDFIDEACNDFVEEAQRIFEPSEWVNGFSWIRIDLECKNCGKKYNLIDFEAM